MYTDWSFSKSLRGISEARSDLVISLGLRLLPIKTLCERKVYATHIIRLENNDARVMLRTKLNETTT